MGLGLIQNGVYSEGIRITGNPTTGILSGVQMGVNGGGLFVNSSNNVGIGTNNPSQPLEVYKNNGVGTVTQMNITSMAGAFTTTNQSVLNLKIQGAGGGTVDNTITGQFNSSGAGTYALSFNPGGTNVMNVLANGNVGIGTTNPIAFAKLYVYSTTAVSGWDGAGYFGNATTGFVCGNYAGTVLIGGHTADLGNWSNLTIGGPGTTTTIGGVLTKGGGTFDIAHPVYTDHKKRLVHSFIEGPRCDLIYRGTKQLVNGTITIDINKECTYNPNGAMDNGTFEALCANAECFLQNKSSFSRVMGTISGCILTITCENATNDTIIWMVIAERKDSFIKKWNRTDDNGFLITQYTNDNYIDI